jgi:hypothetical protein
MRRFHIATALIFLFSSPQALAGPINLLETVDESELAEARLASDWFINDYFIKQETYFAKRYRIVKVNVDLLLNSPEIEMELFDGQSLRLRVTSADVHPANSSIGWTGHFVHPEITTNEIVKSGLPEEDANFLAPAANSQVIGAAEISYNANTRRKYPWYDPRFAEHASATRAYSDDGKSRVYDVSFFMNHSKLPGIYELRSLASDPRYHVLIEHDPEKTFVTPIEKPASAYQSGSVDSAENAAKRHRYQEFLDSLGPDPRPPETTRLGGRPALPD